MLIKDEDISLLTQIGFTNTQAKLYLALISSGRADAKTLSKQANVARQATYRTLEELQQRGIVETIMGLPQKYEAIPVPDGVSIMLKARAQEYTRLLEKTREFIVRFDGQEKKQQAEQDYRISIFEGKEAILKKLRHAHESSQISVCCCSTLQRWSQICMETFLDVESALGRGVKYRVILENHNGEVCLPKEVRSRWAKPNYDLRLTDIPLKMNASIFDGVAASFSFYPSMPIVKSPMIWTNHPSLIVGFQDYIENIWSDTRKVNLSG